MPVNSEDHWALRASVFAPSPSRRDPQSQAQSGGAGCKLKRKRKLEAGVIALR